MASESKDDGDQAHGLPALPSQEVTYDMFIGWRGDFITHLAGKGFAFLAKQDWRDIPDITDMPATPADDATDAISAPYRTFVATSALGNCAFAVLCPFFFCLRNSQWGAAPSTNPKLPGFLQPGKEPNGHTVFYPRIKAPCATGACVIGSPTQTPQERRANDPPRRKGLAA